MNSRPILRSVAHAALLSAAGLGVIAMRIERTDANAVQQALAQTVEVVQTVPARQLLQRLPNLTISSAKAPAGSAYPTIHIDDRKSYQEFRGVGASMTDSSAWLISRLRPHTRAKLMTYLFGHDNNGIRLNFIRIPIGGSDFTKDRRAYTYDDVPPGMTDPRLSRFSINHDRSYIIPVLRQAKALNPHLEFSANPWSPPAWMKANDALDNLHGAGVVLASAYGPLARYDVRFLQAYAKAGIAVSQITPQNEPGVQTANAGATFKEPEMGRFIRRFLRPALRNAGLSTSIFGVDASWDQRDVAGRLLRDARGLTGIDWHCYYDSPAVMTELHREHPHLIQNVDECAPNLAPNSTRENLTEQLRNGANVVSLWNLALDSAGGPVPPNNGNCPGCTGMVTIDPMTDHVDITSDCAELGQIGRFVEPGARRIYSNNFVTGDPHGKFSAGLDDVAFRNPDGSEVLIANNNRSVNTIHFRVGLNGGRSFDGSVPPKGVVTFVWDRKQ